MISAALGLVLAAGSVQWLGPAVPAEVTRVVTLAPSLSETIIALGATQTLVGVSRYDEAPELAQVTRVGGFNDPSIEAIVALKPQLVVVQKAPSNQKPVETLARLGISVLALPLTSVDDVSQAMQQLGTVLHRAEQAAVLVGELASTRARMRSAAKARGKPVRVLFVYGFSPLVVAGPGSFAHELLEDCGGANVAERAATAYPTYSLERVVKLAPEVIIDAADTTTGRDELLALGPLKHSRWARLPSQDLLHPGPALAKGLEALCQLLH
jgi:iron complex transport system substrate-binding protein